MIPSGIFLPIQANAHPDALLLEARNIPTREVDEPPGETVIRGPREGFNESIRDNLSLIRRRIKTANLRIERLRIGRISCPRK